MIATNPKTGKPIRILRSDASVWRSEKTLVYLKDQEKTKPWDRWETVCVGLEDYKAWKSAGKRVDYIMNFDVTDEAAEWFCSVNPQEFRLILIKRDLAMKIGQQKFKSLGIINVVIMEEIHYMYPFLGESWNGSIEDALYLLAGMMRIPYVSGVSSVPERKAIFDLQGFSIQETKQEPYQLYFITQYYKPEKARRAKEIKKCLEMNCKNQLIDKIILLNEQDFSSDWTNSKIQQEIIGTRLTYKHVLQWIQEKAPENTLCVFANADIYLDEKTWTDAWSIKVKDVFFALLRWDCQENEEAKIFGPRNDSQDTWMLFSNSVKSKVWDLSRYDIPFGKAGCDNAITVEMLRNKFLVVNPAMSLKTYHLHITNIRTYDVTDIVDRPSYLYVDPTGIHDMEPLYDLSKFKHDVLLFESFNRPLHSEQPKVLETYCKMLARENRYVWTEKGENIFSGETLPVYKYNNVFQTAQGLVYGFNQLYIGKDDISKDAWSKAQLSPITPSYDIDKCFVVPWIDEQLQSVSGYILHFLGKILVLREKFGSGEFWVPNKKKEVSEALELFAWTEKQLPVIPHQPNLQVWCKEAYQIPYTKNPEVHKEDIHALRKMMKQGWKESSDSGKWVVMIDGNYITMEMVRGWEEANPELELGVVFEDRTSLDRVFEKMNGAKGLICYGGPKSVARWGYSWILPKGAKVIEVQNELEMDGEAAHVSGAAGLEHHLVIIPRASEKITQGLITKHVLEAIKAEHKTEIKSSLPVIRMPRRSLTGFFSHAGDSFREMLGLWASRGYVEVVEDPKAVQIWLGGVGDTLLYDRPTTDWLMAAPPEEQTWKLALFGNPKPNESGGPAKSWFFWPRSPVNTELLVEKGYANKGWDDRKNLCTFHGKIENKVQQKMREKDSWYEVCDDYSMLHGAETPYKLTNTEYLLKLSDAKFGLCLAGFGKKCHREVECMAMGCVPVCAPEVDMTHYANPPEEGLHYIRVQHAEEAKQKLKAITKEDWETMSSACKQWWRDNASAEGSWKLTTRLQKETSLPTLLVG